MNKQSYLYQRYLNCIFNIIGTAIFLAVIPWAEAASPHNRLSDGGFEPGSSPLVGIGTLSTDVWGVEAASLQTGPVGPISPLAGTGMLQINNTSLVVSQVVQGIDVTGCEKAISDGTLGFSISGHFNGNITENATGAIAVHAQDGPGFNTGTKLQTFAEGFTLDTDPTTWEEVSFCDIPLPAGTTHIVVEIAIRNTSGIPMGQPLAFADDFCLRLMELKSKAGCLLGDMGFEPDSKPLLWIGTLATDRWGAEAAELLSSPVGPFSPFAGTGMLQIDRTYLVASQVTQYIDVTPCAIQIENGEVGARLTGYLNGSTTEPVTGSVQIIPQDGPGFNTGTKLDTYSIPFTLDTDPNTWEEFTVNGIPMPSGTTHVGVHIVIANSSTFAIGEPMAFADEFCLELIEHTTDCLLTDEGFEPGSQPLEGFLTTNTDMWGIESAALINGADGTFTPCTGNGMLRLNRNGGVVSQVIQYVDVTGWQTAIDQGGVGFDVSAQMNGIGSESVDGAIIVLAQDASGFATGTILASYSTGNVELDTDVNTWEQVDLRDIPLPPGTTHVGIELLMANSSTVPFGDALGYADDVCLKLTQSKKNGLLHDRDFEPGSKPLAFIGTLATDSWSAEASDLVVGPVGTVSPQNGQGMIRINNTGLIASQVNQNVDLTACTDAVADGTLGFTLTGFVHGNEVEPVTGSINVIAQDASGFNTGTKLEQYIVPFTLDADPGAWEEITVWGGPFPPGTTHLAVHIAFTNSSTLSFGDPLGFADNFCLRLTNLKKVPPTGFLGLPHFPIGDAVLSPAEEGTLFVSNIGSSGEDGVRIELGETEYNIVQFDPGTPAGQPTGSFMEIVPFGELDGVPDQELWTIRVEDVGDQNAVSFDTTPVRPDSVRVEARLGDEIVDSFVFPSAPLPDDIIVLMPVDGCWVDPFWPMVPECWAILALNSPGEVTIAGRQPVQADRIVLATIGQEGQAGAVSATEMRASGIPSFEILDEALGMFELPFRAMGQASLRGDNGQLVVSNIGSSGQDGVSIELDETEGWEATLDLPVDFTALGVGLQSVALGRVDGQDDQVIASATIEGAGDAALLSVDFSNIGSPESLVRLFDAQGNEVGDMTVANNRSLRIPSWLIRQIILIFTCEIQSDVFAINWDGDPIDVGIDGNVFSDVSRIEITAQGITAARDFVSQGNLTATGIEGFALSSASASRPSDSSLTVREEMNCHAMMETLAHSYFMIQQEFGLDSSSQIDFAGSYSESGWAATMSGEIYGQPVDISFVGQMEGALGSDIVIGITANGAMGSPNGPGDAVTIDGSSTWAFDPVSNNYPLMRFESRGTVETPKLKWWVVAIELVAGGTVGGLTGGPGGVIGGAALGLSASNSVGSVAVNEIEDPTRPDPPIPPSFNDLNDMVNFSPGRDQILTRLEGTGILRADVSGIAILEGTWGNGSVTGSGQIDLQFDSWRMTHGITDPDPNADTDWDGITNYLEFLLGSDPQISSTEDLPQPQFAEVDGEDYLTLQYRRSTDAPGLLITAEFSEDLVNWTDGVVVVGSTAGETDGIDIIWRSPVPVSSGTRLFGRLRVEE